MDRALPPMTPYANRSGDSGVFAYALVGDAIVVEFDGGALYLYDDVRPGAAQVRRMRALARAGRGLSGYISREVDGYRARLE